MAKPSIRINERLKIKTETPLNGKRPPTVSEVLPWPHLPEWRRELGVRAFWGH